jgi:hypothetical protein
VSFISSFSRDLCAPQGEEDGEEDGEDELKYVIPTFFTCFAEILAAHAHTEGSFLLGWSDSRFTLGTEPCAKVGSLQPNTVFCPRPN